MNSPMLPRLAAACGIVAPIALFLAVGDGSSVAPWRGVIATWALALFVPFLVYLCWLLRPTDESDGWLATLALAAGLSGLLLKLVSHVPEIAIRHDHLDEGAPLYRALDHMGAAATILSLYPFAICVASVALLVLRHRLLPRWTGILAALTAAALGVNGAFVFAEFVPSFLLFLLWALVTGVVLLRRAATGSSRLAYAT